MTTIVWGTSFPLLKNAVSSLLPGSLLAVRFAVAALVFAPWLGKLNPQLLRDGAILGLFYFWATISALLGLETISANRCAFIVSLNAILVPILGTLLGQRLPHRVLVAAGLAMSGIGAMSWEEGGLGQGELLTFSSAISIAIYILALERIAPRHSTFSLAAVQLWVMFLLSIIWAMPQLINQLEEIAIHLSTIIYLGLVVTAIPIFTQAVAQRWVRAHQAAIIYTLEPVFATFFSFLFLGEQLGIRGFIGAVLVLTATLLVL